MTVCKLLSLFLTEFTCNFPREIDLLLKLNSNCVQIALIQSPIERSKSKARPGMPKSGDELD
jgi:hypothetical protein